MTKPMKKRAYLECHQVKEVVFELKGDVRHLKNIEMWRTIWTLQQSLLFENGLSSKLFFNWDNIEKMIACSIVW